jgi:hypothetical protein
MPSSRAIAIACVVAGLAWCGNAEAQQQPRGFALERFYPSAPGAGWMVMDDLNLSGGLGGALQLSTGYAHNPLRIASADGSQHLSLVRHEAFFAFGAALTYDRFRIYTDMSSPLALHGDSGTIDGYQFTPGRNPATGHACGGDRVCVDPGSNPDTISDARVGFDARILGTPGGPFRLGLSTQIIIPAGQRSEYMTDGTFRAMNRVQFAGEGKGFAYAAHAGVHFRTLDERAPGSPRGPELLFGLAAGPKLSLGSVALIAGPEIYGVSALRALFGSHTTGIEALLSGRLESTGERGAQWRVKLGAGAGLMSEFGVPDYRMLFVVEMFGRAGR